MAELLFRQHERTDCEHEWKTIYRIRVRTQYKKQQKKPLKSALGGILVAFARK